MPTNALANLDRTRIRLTKAKTAADLPDVLKIQNVAQAAQKYAKDAHLKHDDQCLAAEIALLAAHKAGTILKSCNGRNPRPKAGANRTRITTAS
jgi:hypothetical protein